MLWAPFGPTFHAKANLLIDDEIPQPQPNTDFLKFMQTSPIEFSQDPNIRLRHAHGQTQKEMWEIKYGKRGAQNWRLPDLVAFPKSIEEVVQLVESANIHDVVLVPFGGGTLC